MTTLPKNSEAALAAEAENIGINAEGTLRALLTREGCGDGPDLPVAWTQGVRDGWAPAIAVIRAEGANMACPDADACTHTTEWQCAEALLRGRATYRTWPATVS